MRENGLINAKYIHTKRGKELVIPCLLFSKSGDMVVAGVYNCLLPWFSLHSLCSLGSATNGQWLFPQPPGPPETHMCKWIDRRTRLEFWAVLGVYVSRKSPLNELRLGMWSCHWVRHPSHILSSTSWVSGFHSKGGFRPRSSPVSGSGPGCSCWPAVGRPFCLLPLLFLSWPLASLRTEEMPSCYSPLGSFQKSLLFNNPNKEEDDRN